MRLTEFVFGSIRHTAWSRGVVAQTAPAPAATSQVVAVKFLMGSQTERDLVLYLDDRADEAQREALEAIFTGRLAVSQVDHFPWAWKASHLLAVRPAAIEIEHVPGRGWFRAGRYVEVRVGHPVGSGETVTCVIPGHERTGREVIAESLDVSDGALEFSFRGNCGYESDFDYSG